MKEAKERREALRHLSLRLHPDAVLRETCDPVERFDSSLRDLLAEMRTLMLSHRGIGLAAPQVGIRQRLFIGEIEGIYRPLVNPILRPFPETDEMVEGCLSLPGVRVNVRRHSRILVAGYDPRGRKVQWEADALWARVMQHELDHLNGVLILDHGTPIREEMEATHGDE